MLVANNRTAQLLDDNELIDLALNGNQQLIVHCSNAISTLQGG